jgi:hypothetical protein
MDYVQFFGLILTVGGLFIWNRTESRADHRNLENNVMAMLTGIREEIKDFHGRLCAIEERNKR